MQYDFEIFVGDNTTAEVSIATARMCNCTFGCTYCTFCCNMSVLTLDDALRRLACSELILGSRNEKFSLQTFFLGNHVYIVLHSSWENEAFEVSICIFTLEMQYHCTFRCSWRCYCCRLHSAQIACKLRSKHPHLLRCQCTYAGIYIPAPEALIKAL